MLIILLQKSLGQHLIDPNILSHVLIFFSLSESYWIWILVTNSAKLPNLLLVRMRYLNWRLSTGHFDCYVQRLCSILVHSPYDNWKDDWRTSHYYRGVASSQIRSDPSCSIPLIITTLGILGASLRTCKSLSAYVLPHNTPVSRLENLYVYLTTTY